MTLIIQIALTVGMALNTVAIWLLISSNSRLNARISYQEVLLHTLRMDKVMFTQLRKVENGSRVQGVAKDTEVAE